MKFHVASRVRLLPLACLVMAGCVAPNHSLLPGTSSSVAQAHPVMIVSAWENRVVFPQDTVSGQPMPSLVGSVYMLTEESGHPVACDGTLRVDLYDATRVTSAEVLGQPLERWSFDKDNLKKLLRKGKDLVGHRYIVPLMWATYRPDITKVQLQLTFIPEKGTPIQAAPTMVTLNNADASRPAVQQRRDIPAAPGAAPSGAPLPPSTPSTPATKPTVTRIPIPVSGLR